MNAKILKIKLTNSWLHNDVFFYSINVGINGGHLWIGLSDLDEGQFRWSADQQKAEYAVWVSWHKTNDPGKNCVSMYYLGGANGAVWLDWRCSVAFRYICEADHCEYTICSYISIFMSTLCKTWYEFHSNLWKKLMFEDIKWVIRGRN